MCTCTSTCAGGWYLPVTLSRVLTLTLHTDYMLHMLKDFFRENNVRGICPRIARAPSPALTLQARPRAASATHTGGVRVVVVA